MYSKLQTNKRENKCQLKKIPNSIAIREFDDVLSFFTTSKKGHFASESKLFDAVELCVKSVNHDFVVYMSTFPSIAVHIVHGNSDVLLNSKDQLRERIHNTLEDHLKPI